MTDGSGAAAEDFAEPCQQDQSAQSIARDIEQLRLPAVLVDRHYWATYGITVPYTIALQYQIR